MVDKIQMNFSYVIIIKVTVVGNESVQQSGLKIIGHLDRALVSGKLP